MWWVPLVNAAAKIVGAEIQQGEADSRAVGIGAIQQRAAWSQQFWDERHPAYSVPQQQDSGGVMPLLILGGLAYLVLRD